MTAGSRKPQAFRLDPAPAAEAKPQRRHREPASIPLSAISFAEDVRRTGAAAHDARRPQDRAPFSLGGRSPRLPGRAHRPVGRASP